MEFDPRKWNSLRNKGCKKIHKGGNASDNIN